MAKIIKLSTTKINTQYGEKDKFLITVEQDGKQIQADSFCGKWNNDWREGSEIEIKQTQWKSRDYNGKKYWSIMAPPEAKGNFVNPQEISDIKKRLEDVELTVKMMDSYLPMLETLKQQATAKGIIEQEPSSMPENFEEAPMAPQEPADEGVRIEDVPF